MKRLVFLGALYVFICGCRTWPRTYTLLHASHPASCGDLITRHNVPSVGFQRPFYPFCECLSGPYRVSDRCFLGFLMGNCVGLLVPKVICPLGFVCLFIYLLILRLFQKPLSSFPVTNFVRLPKRSKKWRLLWEQDFKRLCLCKVKVVSTVLCWTVYRLLGFPVAASKTICQATGAVLSS